MGMTCIMFAVTNKRRVPKASGVLSWKYRPRKAKVGIPPRSCSVVWNPPQKEGGWHHVVPTSFFLFLIFPQSFLTMRHNAAAAAGTEAPVAVK